MPSVRTYSQAISYLKSLEGKAWNPDNAFGCQCFDTANQYWLYLFNHRLKGVINFENLKVKDVDTTPRINVTAFASNATYEEVYETVMNKPYTRYPVYEGDIDNIIGVFHSKYLLAWSNKKEDQITNYSAKPLFVNEHNKAEWVLRKMTISRKHLAIVLDEFGGTEAIVSHEDLIEELLGMEIEDEMDKKEKEKLSQQQIQFQQRKNRNVSI